MAMSLQEDSDPQISPIDADGAIRRFAKSRHLSGKPPELAAALSNLRNLRHLRIELEFL
jgi:hypothetical protein